MKENKLKVFYAIAAIMLIISIIMIITKGFNVGLDYIKKERLEIYLTTTFEEKDIINIAKEVFENKEIKLRKIEVFNTAIEIYAEEISENEVELLKQKLNEKYNLVQVEEGEELDLSKITVIQTTIPAIRLRNVISKYIIPIIAQIILIIIYIAIIYKKLGIGNVIIQMILSLASIESIYIGILLITRIPINKFIAPIGMMLYVLAVICQLLYYNKQLDNINNQTEN